MKHKGRVELFSENKKQGVSLYLVPKSNWQSLHFPQSCWAVCDMGRISITLDMQDTLRYRYLFLGSSYRNIVAGVFMTTQKSVLHKVATR